MSAGNPKPEQLGFVTPTPLGLLERSGTHDVAWDTAWQCNGRPTLYDFSEDDRVATKARDNGLMYIIRSAEPLPDDACVSFSMTIRSYRTEDLDVGSFYIKVPVCVCLLSFLQGDLGDCFSLLRGSSSGGGGFFKIALAALQVFVGQPPVQHGCDLSREAGALGRR
eukprot:m.40768 g.40768  ORF g.40768 m.40768 type:complete len:166 (-) comp11405_c0_seq1:331-828(-)